MKTPRGAHLTYCTNIHPAESWDEVRRNVETHVVAVKSKVSPSAPFGVGLRLSGRAAVELSLPGEIERFRALLRERGLYVFTLNGFPHGVFHGAAVKEAVYLPDWLDPARLAYSDRLAEILAALLPDEDGLEGTVSTVPGAFKPRVGTAGDVATMAEHLIRHAASLHRIRERTGKTISLALEPEPFCYLETVAETVAFFEDALFCRAAATRFAELTGAAPAAAEAALRRHLGVCFDACHAAVEFEGVRPALDALRAAGIRIGKIQLSAGLEVDLREPARAPALLDALRPFAEGVYLHQVVCRRGEALRRTLDLPEAIAAAERDPSALGTWRIHFHVPIFREALGPFLNTQRYLGELLAALGEAEAGAHLEVETYTWDVLPEEHRREDVDDAVARELAWVLSRLAP
jgi:sugar phosphate isomerase/epimerase